MRGPACVRVICNTYQANSLSTGCSINLANMSVSTGHFTYVCLKILNMGQQLVHLAGADLGSF